MAELIVLDGGGSSGKSSIVRHLEELGYPVIQEVARRVLTERKSCPLTPEEHLCRQRILAQRQYAQEAMLLASNHTEPFIFLDRGLGANPAYCKHLLGFVPNDIQEIVARRRYSYIFIPDQLPFKKDGIRWEKDEKEAQHIHGLIKDSYRELGYVPITLPVIVSATPEEGVASRIDFMFKHIQQSKQQYLLNGERR